MRRTAAVIAVGPLLAAYTVTQNTAENSPTAQSMQNLTWDKQYGGADESYDSRLLALRERIAPYFEVLAFRDSQTGEEMQYNLYTPKNLEPDRKYPLVMFTADASTADKDVKTLLMQGYGGTIWAIDEVQAKHPAFILVPSYTETAISDQQQTLDEVGVVLRLVKSLITQRPIGPDRVYTASQPMGDMISFHLNDIESDFFAASMFVGNQWGINVLKPLARAKFIYTASAADQKASTGMAQAGEMLQQNKVAYAEAKFPAKLPQAE